MSHVLTLVCHQEKPVLSDEILKAVSGLLKTDAIVLAEGIAAEFLPATPVGDDTESDLREIIGDAEIDTALQLASGREKSLLFADMDSTIIQQECLDELAAYAGVKAEISAITEKAMRGELDFEGALKERVAMLEGMPVTKLEDALTECISLTPGAVDLVLTMNARGAMTALVSGGFTFFTHRIAQAVGFQDNQGNVLEVKDGHLTGKLEMPILGRAAKKEALQTIADMHGIGLDQSMAVGDGANDLDMLKAAGTGVAFHAKPIVSEQAKVRIDHADLTALLYLQGIAKTAFVTA